MCELVLVPWNYLVDRVETGVVDLSLSITIYSVNTFQGWNSEWKYNFILNLPPS